MTVQPMHNKRELVRRIRDKMKTVPPLKLYRNSTPVAHVGNTPVLVEGVIRACSFSRSNLLLTGERGEGKTACESDVFHRWYGGNGIYCLAHADLVVRELFQQLNLGKLYRGECKTDQDIRELTRAINSRIVIVDEITRAPPLTQDSIMCLPDGYVEIDGRKYPIGDGNSIMIASGNVGDGKYGGTFKLDAALTDRCHAIIDLNNFTPTPMDLFEILETNHDPHVPTVADEDHSDAIIAIQKDMAQLRPSVEMNVAALFLRYGLDWCEKKKTTKKRIEKALPRICNGCHELGWGCGYVTGISTRAAKAIVNLTLALQQVAASQSRVSAVQPDPLQDMLDVLSVFKLIGPQAGILNEQKVMQDHCGNPYMFLKEIVTHLTANEFEAKRGELISMFQQIAQGRVEQTTRSGFTKVWSFMQDLTADMLTR